MRSEAWRPAAAFNRLPREAREVARQALRPGCEELAVTDPAQMPEKEARPRVKNRHGGAPTRRRQGYGGLLICPRSFSEGGEASVPRHKRVHARLDALWDARRLARRLACRVISAFTRVFDARWRAPRVPLHPNVSRRSAHPSFGVSEARMQNPGANMRRGNDGGCLLWRDGATSAGRPRESGDP